MDGFYCRGNRLGIRLRPVEVAGKPLKKFIDILPFGRLFCFWIGRFWIVWTQVNLIADIVGEFTR
jgi:hypothetical protein